MLLLLLSSLSLGFILSTSYVLLVLYYFYYHRASIATTTTATDSEQSPAARPERICIDLPRWKKYHVERYHRVEFLMANIDTLLVDPSLYPNTETFKPDPSKDQSVVSNNYREEHNFPPKRYYYKN